MGCSYDTYRTLIRSAQAQAKLDAGYTPHKGQDFVSVREGGRWLSYTSLRVYLDLVGAAFLAQQHKVQNRQQEFIFAASHSLDFLPGAFGFQRAKDQHGSSARDPFARARWSDVPTMGPSPRANAGGPPGAQEARETQGRYTASASDGSSDDSPRVRRASDAGSSEE